ncbi:hypothetical protein IU510_14710 [Nocardia cyriacigeorgica]|uniref:hypothetical protein n=1 Tax=Nocardia cyriacigeorgica TaxID=135487 RepID=UPI0018935F54|nr:hypothetical protein [Nocardia cyriacigeorgica]MBF6099329.1 hypothetical protein [Nocardia cyriacigeorgica]
MSPLVLIVWAASTLFTAVLSFRVGYWWKTTELHGRHALGAMVATDERPLNEQAFEYIDDETLGLNEFSDDTEELPLFDGGVDRDGVRYGDRWD